MKRRSHTTANPPIKTSKPSTKTLSSSGHKKRNAKSHNQKNIKTRKKPIQDYFIINDNVYTADTKTQRQQVDKFVSRLRSEACIDKLRSSKKFIEEPLQEERLHSPSQSTQIISMQDYVNSLNKQQKMKLLQQLQKQMLSNPQVFIQSQQSPQPLVSERQQKKQDFLQDKMQILNQKICSVKLQLEGKKQAKISQLSQKLSENLITQKQYESKIKVVNKIMQRNIKLLQCTKSLFQTILNSNYNDEFLKNSRQIEAAMKEFDSFSQIESPVKQSYSNQRVESESSIHSEADFQKLNLNLEKDHEEASNSAKKQSVQEPLLISPDKTETDLELQKFQCAEESLTKKLKIPLLMTKDRIEQLEQEKKVKATQKMKSEIDKKIGFQMSQIETDQFGDHFTTLADINGYIVGLYQFIIRNDLQKIVERLNFPFGKSVRDKLYLLQQNGEVDENQYYPVLDETYYNQYNKEVTLSIRKIPEEEKVHSKAIFDCFNTYLNAYRPYYELEGEVYPWSISQKGITFYEINEQNIEQVFEKTKIKVLEFASTLCGIIPHGIDASECPELVKQKNQQFALKEERQAITEQFQKWDIKIINYEVMVRFLITEQILMGEIMNAIQQFPIF